MKFEDIILGYLDKRAAEDALFAEAYAKEGKSIEQCCAYIMSEARKYDKGNSVCVPDEVVYGWAVHYYDEDDIEVEEVECKVDVQKHDPIAQPKKEPKKELKKRPKKPTPFTQLSLFG